MDGAVQSDCVMTHGIMSWTLRFGLFLSSKPFTLQVGGDAEAESSLDHLNRLVSMLRSELEKEKGVTRELQQVWV